MNKFYGIGVGPGDPELITLKALNVLEKADIIFAPRAKTKEESLAGEIVEKVLRKKKDICELEFPMTNNREELRERYFKSAELILKKISEGKAAAYLTIGDPLLYSTYIYLVNALLEEMGILQNAIFGSHVGLEGERLIDGRKEPFTLSEKEGYLSTIIVRKGKI